MKKSNYVPLIKGEILKVKHKTLHLMLFFMLAFVTHSYSQFNNGDFEVVYQPTVPSASVALGIGPAGQSDNEIGVTALKSSVNSFTITMQLPQGVSYVAGTVTKTQDAAGTYVVAESDISDLHNPVFSIYNNGNAGDNWGAGDSVIFTFTRQADCDAVVYKETPPGGIFKDNAKIDYNSGSATDTDATSGTYDLIAPSLQVQSPISPVTGVIGNVHTRQIEDVNAGNTFAVNGKHLVSIGTDISNYKLYYNGVEIPRDPSSTATDLVFNWDMTQPPFNAGNGAFEDGNGKFDDGETLVFTEEFELLDCNNTNIEHRVAWDCVTSQPVTGAVLFGSATPDLGVRVIENDNDVCGINHVKIEITNNGNSIAKDVLLTIGLGSNEQLLNIGYNNNNRWSHEHYGVKHASNFKLGGNSVPMQDWASGVYSGESTKAYLPDVLTTDPDGAGGYSDIDGDGFFDDLAVGDTIVFEYDFEYSFRENCGSSSYYQFNQWEHRYFNALSKDQCGNEKAPKGVDLGYRNFIRNYLNPTYEEQDTDATDNNPFEVAVAPSVFNNMNHNGHWAIDANADNDVLITFTIPNGVTLDAGSPLAANFTVVNANTITYSTDNLYGGHYILRNEFPDDYLRLPLVASCGGGAPNLINISYQVKMRWYDAGGAVCLERDVICDDFLPIHMHGCQPCDGPNITSLDSHRTTPGWTDHDMTQLVDLSSGLYELDKYLAGDNMEVVAEGFMSNMSATNLHFRQTYQTDGTTLGADDLIFLDGTVYFHDDSAGTDTPVRNLAAPTITSNGNVHTADFDLSSFLNDLGGSIDDQDKFYVKVNWKFRLDTYYSTALHTMGFRGRFYTHDPAHPNADADGNVSCDDWGDSVSYLREDRHVTGYNSTFKNCENGNTRTYNATWYSGAAHLHPGEYRPMEFIQEINATVPDGVTVVDAYQQTSEGNYYVSNGDLTMVQTGPNTYKFTPSGNFKNSNQVGQVYYSFYLIVQGSCELEEIEPYTVETITKDYAYSDAPIDNQFTVTRNIIYQAPSFNFTAIHPTVTGYGPEANFDLQVSNTSGSDVDYLWIKVPDVSNITVTSAEDITATPATALPAVVHVGGASYIKIGGLADSATKNIRIKATYDTCANTDVDFQLGWDCNAYPTDFSTTTNTCYKDTETITLIPADALIQQTITQEPGNTSVTNCSPFTLVMQYNSGLAGTVVNPTVTFEPVGGTAALDVNQIEVEYPEGSGNWETVPAADIVDNGTGYTFPITHSAMTPYGGLPGTGAVGVDVSKRKVNVKYTLQTTCEYVSNSPIAFIIEGNRTCGDPAQGNHTRVYTEGIVVTGLEPDYRAFPEMIVPDMQACSNTYVIDTKSTIRNIVGQPAAVTGNDDYGKLVVPAGVEYVLGSFTNVGDGTHNATLVSETAHEVIFKYPAGMQDNDFIHVTYTVQPLNGVCSENAVMDFYNYVEAAGVPCGGGPACADSKIQTGDTHETFAIQKANIVASATASSATLTATNSANAYQVTLNVTNDGDVDMPAGYAYDFYCADATGNPTGASIYSGTLADPLAAGASATLNLTFNGSEACDAANGIVFVMEPNATNCLCGNTQIPMALAVTPIQAMDDSFTTGMDINVVSNVFDDHGNGDDILGTTPTTVTDYTQPSHGTVTVQPDGTFTYDPNPGFTGTDTFTYTITDANGITSTATVTIVIPAAPTAQDDDDLNNPAGPVTIADITADNGHGPDTADPVSGATLDPATITLIVPAGATNVVTDGDGDVVGFDVPGEGTWSLTPAGAVTFTPEAGFTADPTPINYTIDDSNGLTSNEATITITYVKIPPVAQDDDSLNNVSGSTVTINPLVDNGHGPDSDPDGSLDPTTVSLVMPAGATNVIVDANGDVTGFNVPGEGNWSVNPFTGEVTFTPEAGFTGNPTPVNYTIEDNDGNESNQATITITYAAQPPVAVNDEDLGNTPGDSVTLPILANDNDPDGSLDPNSVVLTGSNPGTPHQLVVPGEGTWNYNPATGELTFTPEAGITNDPTPITYTVNDNDGNTSNAATVTVDYIPVSVDDISTGNTTNTPVTLNITNNDTNGDVVDITTVSLIPPVGATNIVTDANGHVTGFDVPGEGNWTYNPATGEVTFTPEAGFTSNPTPIDYTVEDNEGNVSNPSSITIEFTPQPPVAQDDDDLNNVSGTVVSINPLVDNGHGADYDPDGSLDPTTVSLVIPAGATSVIVDANGDVTGFDVPGEGNWSVNPTTGLVTFTPEASFIGDPTPVNYTIEDNDGNESNQATITITYDCNLPAPTSPDVRPTFCSADNATLADLVVDNVPAGASVVWYDAAGNELPITTILVDGVSYFAGFAENPPSNCVSDPADRLEFIPHISQTPEDPNGATLQQFPYSAMATATLADLDVTSDGQQFTLNYYDELADYYAGNSIPSTTLLSSLQNNDVVISQSNADGCESVDLLTVIIEFLPNELPVANDDSATTMINTPVTFNVTDNDTDADGTIDPSTVDLDPSTPGNQSTYTDPDGNVWTVDANGNVTFTPAPGFTGEATIPYTVEDNDGGESNQANITVFVQDPELTVTKDDAIPANATVGDDIVYTIVVTNTGNVTLTNIDVSDANAVIGGNHTISSLAPGASATLTAVHTITLADMNNGTISNTAVASTTFEGTPVSDDSDDPNFVPSPGDPDTDHNPTVSDLSSNQVAELTATLDDNDPSSPGNPSVYNAGDPINYNLYVENTGNTSITNPVPPAGYTPVMNGSVNVGDTNGDGILDPGETWEYTGSHTLTQAEIDAGMYSTQVSVSGTDVNNNQVTDPASDDPQTNAPNDPTNTYFGLVSELELTKRDQLPLFVMVGEDITYEISVTNTGNTTISNVTITDTNAQNITYVSGDDGNGTLDPGETWVYSATHTITQDDMDAGSVANTASVTGDAPNGDPVTDEASNDPDTPDPNDPTVSDLHSYQDPSMLVTKDDVGYTDNGLAGPSVGDVITYEISIQNNGNTTLSNITVIDMMLSNAGVTPVYTSGDLDNDGNLDVNETWVYTADYVVTQADMDAGMVENSATGYGVDSNGVPLFDVSDDPNFIPGPGNPDTDENPTVTNLPQTPELTVTKDDNLSLTPPPANLNVGDYITYTIVVTNTGNVTVDNISVTDTNAVMNGVGSTPALEPGDSVSFTAVHQITQDDMDQGFVDNQATANGTDPNGAAVSDVSDDPETVTPDDVTHTDLTGSQTTGIAVTLDDNLQTDINNPYNFNVGDVITYTAEVSNTGNVSVTPDTPAGYTPVEQGGFNIGDTDHDGMLDPDETWVYTTTHTVTQADIDAGHVDNQVTFTGTAANGDTVSDLSDDPQDQTTMTDDVTVTYIGQVSELTVVKTGSFQDDNANGIADVGETITYTITVTNNSNVTITDVQVTDPNAVVTPTGSQVDLLPGESYDFTATHTLTQADIDAGEVENQATATGQDPSGNDVSDISDDPNTGTPDDATIVTVPVHAEITIEKTGQFIDANGNGYADVGEVITYTFKVRNAGNQTVSNLTIDDPFLTAAGAIYDNGDINGNNLLDIDETWEYTGTHVLTQSDIDTGNIENQATAMGEDPIGNTLTDLSDDPNDPTNDDVEGDGEPDDVTNTPVPQHPELSLIKTGVFNDENGDGLADIGETISYTFTVTNIGNVTLTDVEVTDALPGIEIYGTPIILAPGQSDNHTFTAVYTLTKDDIDNGFVSNSALVTGTDSQGNDTTDVSDDPNNNADVDSEGDGEPDDPTVIETLGLDIMTIFTPNGDGLNDTWEISGIQNFPHNTVKVYNRWGNLVYEKEHYLGNWDGTSNGRWTIAKDGKLPVATYFYVIDLGNGHKPFTGYLYLNR